MKKFIALITALLLTLALCSCSTQGEPINPGGDEPMDPINVTGETKFNNHHQLVDDLYDGGNITISEFSLNMLLTMIVCGAEDETLEQLEDYMGLSKEEAEETAQALSEYYEALQNSEILLANGAWTDENTFKLDSKYESELKEKFEAYCASLDFNDPASADAINDWCSDNTKGLIKELLKAEDMQGLALVLANALYFNGSWETPYTDEQVEEGADFTNADGTTSQVNMLHSTEGIYLENDNATGFMKPYNDGIYFVGILPKDDGDFKMSDLDIEGLLDSQTGDYDVETTTPEFEMECEMDMNEALKALGLTSIFDSSNAGLAGIGKDVSGNPPFVSLIKQKTAVKLDKEGTEAAAITGGMMKATSIEPDEPEVKTVSLDRPFAYLIYDATNDTILFEGKIVKGSDR